ncbi:MAG TPA: YtxH domain-containing protein [Firmicutes bacterium]|nr:YtxH domain-containing protein [Bacillota bacterium]
MANNYWRGLLTGSVLGIAATLFMVPETRATSRRRLIDVAGELGRSGWRRMWKGIRTRAVRMVVR